MNDQSLIVENVWSHPRETNVHFLQKCCLYVQVRNKLGRSVRIEGIECRFESEDGVKPYIPSQRHIEDLQHGYLSDPIAIEFEADLALKAYTNYYHIIISYDDGNKRTLDYDPKKFFVFYPLGHARRQFFISHKDPQDTNIGRQLAGFLSKLGFIGYLSEDDHRPGIDLWKEKIPAAISASIGVVILWTSNAAKDPSKILRELEMAKLNGKPLILAPQRGIRVPKKFPRRIEYFRFKDPLSDVELKGLALSIHTTD